MKKKIITLLFLLPLAVFSAFAQDSAEKDILAQNLLLDAVSRLDTDPVRAKEAIEKLDRNYPANDAVKYYMGLMAYSAGDLAGAEKYLSEAVRLDSCNLWYKDALAGLFAAEGRNHEAADLYIPLVEARPSYYANAYTLTLIGDRYLSLYSDSLARDSYDKALSLSPGYSPALLGRAELNRMTGNMAAFFADARQFVRDPAMKPYSKCNYVTQLLKHVDYPFYVTWGAQLDSLVNFCVQAHPADSSALRLAGSWYYSTERKELGTKYFNRLLEEYPDDLSAHYTKLSLIYDGGNMRQVLEECETIIKLGGKNNPEVIPAMSTAGDCWHAVGNDRMAMKYYDKVLRLEPDNVLTLNNYAYYLSLSGKKLKKAEQMSRRTIELEPENPSYLDTYGWILHLLGRDAEAKPYFKKAMIYGGKDHLDILEHYSVVLDALGEKELSQYYRTLADNKKAGE